MGVTSGSKMLHSASSISLENVVTVLWHGASSCGSRIPAVAFDANWLSRKFGIRKSSPVIYIMEMHHHWKWRTSEAESLDTKEHQQDLKRLRAYSDEGGDINNGNSKQRRRTRSMDAAEEKKAGWCICFKRSWCDGPSRHHSKKAFISRMAKTEQAKLDVLFYRKKLLELVEKSCNPQISQEEAATNSWNWDES